MSESVSEVSQQCMGSGYFLFMAPSCLCLGVRKYDVFLLMGSEEIRVSRFWGDGYEATWGLLIYSVDAITSSGMRCGGLYDG